eukprot:TRINITY_DN1938_c0_g1_i1.p1 TRINITY_DN1938_c0_g1~~TRINITY_DN1938_c0_g1_i1.p1  ORF type:complete len:159 (-),score=52.38 TRINITY_DN1938_c0_g1_i1:255-731(-)
MCIRDRTKQDPGATELGPLDADLDRVKAEVQATPKKVRIVRSRRRGILNRTKLEATNENLWKGVDYDHLCEHAVSVWKTYDADHNGVLDQKEVQEMVRHMLAAMPELTTMYFDDALSPEQMIKDLDRNAKSFTDDIFRYADANGDGLISKREFVKFFQ